MTATRCGWMVTTPTSGGPPGGGPADFGLPQPASSRPTTSEAGNGDEGCLLHVAHVTYLQVVK